MDNLYMKDLITKKHKHLLYKDESPELCDFLILNYAEVYRMSKTELRLLIFNKSKFDSLHKTGLIYDEIATDDKLHLCTTSNANLGDLIALGSPKQRIYKRGKKLLKLQELLGHKILPFNPLLN